MKHSFTPSRIFALMGVVALTALVLSFSTAGDDKDRKKKSKVEKRIEMIDENGQKKVTITTIENGNKTVETYTGEEAEKYMQRNNQGAGQGFHMSFDFDIDTAQGKNSFDFYMNGVDLGEEFEKEMQELMEELKSSGSQIQFELDNILKSMDTAGFGKGYNYSFNFDSNDDFGDLKELDSLLENLDIDINIQDLDSDNGSGQQQRKTIIIKHSVVMEDMGKKGVEKDLHVSDISFYPNPNAGNFTLRYKSESMDMIEIAVSDLSGKNIYNERVSATGTILRNIELNQPAGTYILTLQQGKKKVSKKLIIE